MAIWPFGRRRDADAPAPEPAAAESASPATGEADVARPERQPTGDWMTLPPLHTTAAPTMPPTFRVQRLPEILTSHQDTRLSGSLGHAVSADAPSGTIGDLAQVAGSVSHDGSRAVTELREPHHGSHATPDVAAPVQRRLATTDDRPLGVTRAGDGPLETTVAPPAPALPEPAVSRVLASREPAPAPSAGERPLPVARVVDAPTTTSATGAGAARETGATSAPPSAAAERPAETGLVGDERVGGFEVDLGSLLGGDAADEPLPVITPPAELAPPIQRTIRRGADGAPLRAPVQRAADTTTPTSPATTAGPADIPATSTKAAAGEASTHGAALPPIQRLSTDAPAAPAAANRPLTGSEPVPVNPDPDRPLLADDPTAGLAAGTSRGTSELPLVAPPVQRAADTASAVGPTASSATPATTASTEASDASASASAAATSGAAEVADPAVQRAAEAGGDHFPGDGHDHGGDEPGAQRVADPSSTAPLAGEAPTLSGAGIGSTLAGDDDDAAPAASGDLPLVARMVEPAAPTLGTGGGGHGSTPLQTLSDTVSPMPGGGTSSLPLAPPDGPGSLIPPATPTGPGGPGAATTGLIGDPPTSTAGSSLAAQRVASTSTTTSGSVHGGSGALPFAVQRQASTAAGASSSAASAMTSTSLASAGSLFSGATGASAAGGAPAAPLTVLGAMPAEAPAVPLQRSFDAPLVAPMGSSAAAASAGSAPAAAVAPASATAASNPAATGQTTTASRLPLAGPAAPVSPTTGTPTTPLTQLPTQRSVDPSPGGGASSMPLHTPAANVPSTTDLLVKAGLGEKGPDGSFLRSTPPAGVESSFTVQTMAETPSSAPAAATPVQRGVEVSDVSTSVAGGEAGGGQPDQDVRKLYLKIRAEMEADLRRQLEAKSRYNRYRP